MSRNVAILIFDKVEVLDFCGPFEISGIDMSLYVVGKLLGQQQANDTARYIQYDYWPREHG